MKKMLVHPLLVVLTMITFLGSTTGCDRTVTKYNRHGEPYTTTEFSAIDTLAAVVLFVIILGALSTSDTSGSSLHVDPEVLFASFGGQRTSREESFANRGTNVECFRTVDENGHMISEHILRLDRSLLDSPVIDASQIQLSSTVDRQVVRSLVRQNRLNSMPSSIKADVAWLPGKPHVLRVNALRVQHVEATDSTGKIIRTRHGDYGVIAVSGGEPGHITVTVSQIDPKLDKKL